MAERFVHRIRVRYGEVDMQRVVFNAHYLAYCDDACEAWMSGLALRAAAPNWDFMLKKATIEWTAAATVYDELAITVWVSRWGNTSFDVSFDGKVEDRAIFTSTITYVGVVEGTLTTAPVPDAVRTLLGP